ncbi:hypothetical protein P3X46_029610 [Hevea brasiliensis]|uniref:Uncharacterized protein n=1 Tax=Hevea brasiliensis TaxID=3981 RepID=A0ABQ9KSR2_HEVBR|nr:hypothetical protein P3X46_029610 [Hevea brasiliensis]
MNKIQNPSLFTDWVHALEHKQSETHSSAPPALAADDRRSDRQLLSRVGMFSL